MKTMWRIVLRRTNGRFVKYIERPFKSSYAAKHRIAHWETKYNEKSYYFEVEEV